MSTPTTTVRLDGDQCACSPGELCPVNNRRVGSEYRCSREQIEAAGFGVEEQAFIDTEYPVIENPEGRYYVVYEECRFGAFIPYTKGPFITVNSAQDAAIDIARRFSTAFNVRVTDKLYRSLMDVWLNSHVSRPGIWGTEGRDKGKQCRCEPSFTSGITRADALIAATENTVTLDLGDESLVEMMAESIHAITCTTSQRILDKAIRQPNGGIELGAGRVALLDSHQRCAYGEQWGVCKDADRKIAKGILQRIKDYCEKKGS
uniref:Uncharacterized protein n=1 Tax=viral metagenome TaxID=1070528 RepID=A0A6H1ZI79_9ZZZZ